MIFVSMRMTKVFSVPPYYLLMQFYTGDFLPQKLLLFVEFKSKNFQTRDRRRISVTRFDEELKFDTCFGCSVTQRQILHNTCAKKFGNIDKNQGVLLCRVMKKLRPQKSTAKNPYISRRKRNTLCCFYSRTSALVP